MNNKKTDIDLTTTIILIFVFMIVAFGLFSFWFGKPKECNWVSDKGVMFENEQQVKDFQNYVNNRQHNNRLAFIKACDDMTCKRYDYMYFFIDGDITYSDAIRKVC